MQSKKGSVDPKNNQRVIIDMQANDKKKKKNPAFNIGGPAAAGQQFLDNRRGIINSPKQNPK